jgi:hypothetical protein
VFKLSKLEELKAMVSVLQKKIEALEKPKQWEPCSGRYLIKWDGVSSEDTSCHTRINFGVERHTEYAACKARDAIRTHNRLLAYVDEFGGDWEADWSFKAQNKYYIVYDRLNHNWVLANTYRAHSLGAVYMSQECGEGLIAKLESGEVVL